MYVVCVFVVVCFYGSVCVWLCECVVRVGRCVLYVRVWCSFGCWCDVCGCCERVCLCGVNLSEVYIYICVCVCICVCSIYICVCVGLCGLRIIF